MMMWGFVTSWLGVNGSWNFSRVVAVARAVGVLAKSGAAAVPAAVLATASVAAPLNAGSARAVTRLALRLRELLGIFMFK